MVSGGGSNLQVLIDGVESGRIKAKIEVVISSKENALALERAKNYNIQGVYIGKNNFPNLIERNNRILEVLMDNKIDLVVLAGYMNILDIGIIKQYQNRIMNIHPSLIPSFCGRGYYGEKVHGAVLEYGVKVTGATVHFVDEGTDTGPIILQEAVAVLDNDTKETLAKRVLAVEHRLLPRAVQLFCDGKLKVEGRRVIINE